MYCLTIGRRLSACLLNTSTPRPLVQKKTWRDSLPIDMLFSAVSVLVVVQSSSEIPEGLMNNPVFSDERRMFIRKQVCKIYFMKKKVTEFFFKSYVINAV